MRNLAAANGSNVSSNNRQHCCRSAGQRYEFDFVSFIAWINVNHCADIPGFKTLCGIRDGKHDSVMFFDHKF